LRKCKTCGKDKDLNQFIIARSKKGKVYYCGFCKDCDNKRRKEEYYENHKHELEYRRNYYRKNKEKWTTKPLTDEQKKRKVEKQRERRKNDRRRSFAYKQIMYAVRDGNVIVPNNCEICNEGNTKIVGHHEDYDKPLEVQWICEGCHATIHGLKRRIVPQNV